MERVTSAKLTFVAPVDVLHADNRRSERTMNKNPHLNRFILHSPRILCLGFNFAY